MADSKRELRTATKLVRGGLSRSDFGETSEAIFMTSGFRYDEAEIAEARFKGEQDGYTYSRLSNPTIRNFEARLALLEGTDCCRGTASGMAAVTAALLCMVKAGDKVVAASALFGSTRYLTDDLLPRYGVETEVVNGTDLAAWEKAITDNTVCVMLESPSNPGLDIIDMQAVADLAHKVGALVLVDNAFATPILQRPREFGADVVIYSATKYIDGQGRALGGAICCTQEFEDDYLTPFLRNTGPTLSPFNAWLMVKGLETLELRINRHCENAAFVADFLAEQGAISRCLYPGRKDHPQHELAMKQMSLGGGIITFDLAGGKEAAFKLVNALEVIDISNNLGDAKSLITHPASTTHQRLSEEERLRLGIGEGTLRLSVGLEDKQDLVDDLAIALKGL